MVEKDIESKQLELDGFSGNKIEVIRLKGKTFVRKTASNTQQNKKIENEIKKLEKLKQISEEHNIFKIPKINDVSKDKNQLSYYELEFISGENLDSSLQKLSSEKIKNYSKKIGDIIRIFSHYPANSGINEKQFLQKKFDEMITKISKKELSTNLGRELVNECCNKVGNLEISNNDLNNKATFCHGDLALDNILITKKGEIYLIDPLQNEYENTMWDYAKVLQSSMTYWNLIKYQNFQLLMENKKIVITPNEHISMFHNHFLNNLNFQNTKTITLYLAATLSRITKYTKTEKQLCALIIIINELLSDYSDGNCDLSGTLNSLRW